MCVFVCVRLVVKFLRFLGEMKKNNKKNDAKSSFLRRVKARSV